MYIANVIDAKLIPKCSLTLAISSLNPILQRLGNKAYFAHCPFATNTIYSISHSTFETSDYWGRGFPNVWS